VIEHFLSCAQVCFHRARWFGFQNAAPRPCHFLTMWAGCLICRQSRPKLCTPCVIAERPEPSPPSPSAQYETPSRAKRCTSCPVAYLILEPRRQHCARGVLSSSGRNLDKSVGQNKKFFRRKLVAVQKAFGALSLAFPKTRMPFCIRVRRTVKVSRETDLDP